MFVIQHSNCSVCIVVGWRAGLALSWCGPDRATSREIRMMGNHALVETICKLSMNNIIMNWKRLLFP